MHQEHDRLIAANLDAATGHVVRERGTTPAEIQEAHARSVDRRIADDAAIRSGRRARAEHERERRPRVTPMAPPRTIEVHDPVLARIRALRERRR